MGCVGAARLAFMLLHGAGMQSTIEPRAKLHSQRSAAGRLPGRAPVRVSLTFLSWMPVHGRLCAQARRPAVSSVCEPEMSRKTMFEISTAAL